MAGETEAWAVPLPTRGTWRVTGGAPLAFLELTTSQAVEQLRPGHGALTCVLDDKGRVLAELHVLPLSDGSVLLEGERAGEEGIDYLSRVAPLSGCEVVPEALPVTAIRGTAFPADELAFVEHDDGSLLVRIAWGGPGIDVIGEQPTDARAGTFDEFEAARVAVGRPRYGVDVTAEMLVNETPLLSRAVSFAKGCYPGQESVARVHNLGRVRRMVIGLHAPGASLTVGDLDDGMGRITSAMAEHALAYVRAEALEAGVVRAGGAEAEVRALG